MQDINYIVLSLSINIICLLIGYILGRLNSVGAGVSISKPKSYFNQKEHEKITIDDKKVVTEIKIDNLEKKFNTLGTKTVSDENISSSINKLKNMKG
jgi:hypothetical protein